jgi:hypothetical protein
MTNLEIKLKEWGWSERGEIVGRRRRIHEGE